MARTSSAKIIEWGTPPAPEPTGWEAIAIELVKRPGEWANIGEFTAATARKIAKERFTTADGYEVRPVPTATPDRVAVWVRHGSDDLHNAETRTAILEAEAEADREATHGTPPKSPRTVKRGSVV